MTEDASHPRLGWIVTQLIIVAKCLDRLTETGSETQAAQATGMSLSFWIGHATFHPDFNKACVEAHERYRASKKDAR